MTYDRLVAALKAVDGLTPRHEGDGGSSWAMRGVDLGPRFCKDGGYRYEVMSCPAADGLPADAFARVDVQDRFVVADLDHPKGQDQLRSNLRQDPAFVFVADTQLTDTQVADRFRSDFGLLAMPVVVVRS